MPATQQIRVTLPPEIGEDFEKACRAGQRTPAELVREAVRSYLSFLRHFPEVTPTGAERRMIRAGRQAYTRGEYIGLNELLGQMATGRNQTRRKKPKKVSRKG